MKVENQIVERVLKLLIDNANCTKPEDFNPKYSEHVVCLLVTYITDYLGSFLQEIKEKNFTEPCQVPDDIRAGIRELVGHVFCILHPALISDNDQWKYEPIEIQPFDTALEELRKRDKRRDYTKHYRNF